MHQRDRQYARVTAVTCVVFFVIALGYDYWPTSNAIRWQTFDAAKSEARGFNKPLFLDVYAEWCIPCKNMDRFVFPEDSIKEILNSRYALARVNIDDPALGDSIRKTFLLRAVPTYIVLTPSGRERKRHEGFFEKSGFLKWLSDSSQFVILSWLDFKKAQAKATAEDRRLMILTAQSHNSFTRLNTLFDTPDVLRLIDSLYVPVLLVSTSPEDAKILDDLGGRRTWMDEVIVLEEGSEVGRFPVTPDMQFSTSVFLNKLYELSARRAPPSLRRTVPGGKTKKMS